MTQNNATQAIVDVPADLLERYLAATSKALVGLGPSPTAADLQQRLWKAAEEVGVKSPVHAGQLALRYSLLVDILQKNMEKLRAEGHLEGDAGPGKTTTFSIPFVATVARIPARLTASGPICDMPRFWSALDVTKKAMESAAPSPEALKP